MEDFYNIGDIYDIKSIGNAIELEYWIRVFEF